MASPALVVRAGVGSWTSIRYLLTRGLGIDTPAVTPDVISLRHSSSPRVIRQSESTFDARRSTSPLRTRLSES